MSVADHGMPGGALPLNADAWAWIDDRLRRDRHLLRALLQAFAEGLMVLEAEGRCCGNGERTNRRNGYRIGTFVTTFGPIPVRIPKLRQGSYAPAWLTQRPGRTDDVLVESLCRGYVQGMTSALVARLLVAFDIEGTPEAQRHSTVAAINRRIDAVRSRPLAEVRGADVVVEALNHAGRVDGGDPVAVSMATTSVNSETQVLGVAVCVPDVESAVQELLRGLVARGLTGDVSAPDVASAAPRRSTRPVTIIVRRHGRRSDDAAMVDESPPRSARRTPLLLAVAAVLVMAAAVIGSLSVNRSRANPKPPTITTVSSVLAAEVVAPPVAASAPAPAASSVPPPSSIPAPSSVPAPSTTTAAAAAVSPDLARCTDALTSMADQAVPAGRLPWMDEVHCEAVTQPPAG